MRLPDFLQFTPDERRAALAILLFTGGGGLLLEIGRRHPAWTPDLLSATRGRHSPAPVVADSNRVSAALIPGEGAPRMSRSASGADTVAAAANAGGVSRPDPLSALTPDRATKRHETHHSGASASKRKTGPSSPIDVNAADSTLLVTLPGIGPAMAGRIISDRRRNGPFRSMKDLTRVKGIGKATATRLEPFLRFGPP